MTEYTSRTLNYSNTSTTFPSNVTSLNNSSGDFFINEDVALTATYVGCCLSITAILIALATFSSSGQLRVKRPHMITCNLCIAFLILYIGILLSSIYETRSETYSSGCTAGAILIELGVFLIWIWLSVHWGYLSYTAYRASTSHISNFFIKLALPANGIGVMALLLIVISRVAKNEPFTADGRCLVYFNSFSLVLTVVYVTICIFICSFCFILCIFRSTCRKPKNVVISATKRTRLGIFRLSAITLAVMVCTSIAFALHANKFRQMHYTLQLVNGILSAFLGVFIVAGLVFRNKEFRIHWKAVLQGKNPTREQSMHRVMSKMNSSFKSNSVIIGSPKHQSEVSVRSQNDGKDVPGSPISLQRMIPRDNSYADDFDEVFCKKPLKKKTSLPLNGVNEDLSSSKGSKKSKNDSSGSVASLRRNLFRGSVRKVQKLSLPLMSPAKTKKEATSSTLNRTSRSSMSFEGVIRKSSF